MEVNTRAHIKDRMVKNAAQMWNVQANEIETSFDPIVTLLLSACASEIEKIEGEVNSSTTRITEQIVQLMTPENIYGPSLAHGILHAEPIDDSVTVKSEFLFNYRKQKAHNTTSLQHKDIYFSPVQNFKLINADIQFIATGETLREIGKNGDGSYTNSTLECSKLPASTLYLGIASNLQKLSLKHVSFYFDLNIVSNDELFFHHLANAKWSSSDGAIEVTNGLRADTNTNISILNGIFENVSSKTYTTCQRIIKRYERNYITLISVPNSKKSKFSELKETLEVNGIKSDKTVHWLKIEFSTVIDNAILKNVNCSLNAFPVANRKLENFSYSTKEFINLLPIQTKDLFFDIKSITNTDGKTYIERSKVSTKIDKGNFVLRGNGIGKLNRRTAREYILYLIELLKDESAAFSFLNNDFLRGNLKILNQTMALLEKKVSEASNDVLHTKYASLKPYKTKEQLLVEYWTTNGDEGNQIKSGSKLSVYKGFGVKQNSSYFLTTTHGGKADLKFQDCLNLSRKSLLSKDCIVTKEDVKVLCAEIFGNKTSKVEIKRGYKKAVGLKKGLLPCMEIILTVNTNIRTEDIEWKTLEANLLFLLKKKSTNVLPFKVSIIHQRPVIDLKKIVR